MVCVERGGGRVGAVACAPGPAAGLEVVVGLARREERGSAGVRALHLQLREISCIVAVDAEVRPARSAASVQ